MTIHTVQKGDNLSKIARQYKLKDWRVIYNHPENAAFRKRRKNPNLILPGDEIYIPPTQDQSTSVNTGKIHQFVIKPDVPLPDLSWLKVRVLYDDPWETPLPEEQVDIRVDNTVFAEKQALQTGAGKNSRVRDQAAAKETAQEPGTLVLDEVPQGDVELEFSRVQGIEQEIETLRNSIEIRLDGAYHALVNEMSEFQKQWDDYGAASILMSGSEGLYQGAADWVKDQGELLEAETWRELGRTFADVTGNVWDYTATYVETKYNDLKKSAAEVHEDLEEAWDNAFNWNWWSQQIDGAQADIEERAVHFVDEIKSEAEQAADLLQSSVSTAEKIYRHRQAIMSLPNQMAQGDVAAIERFIDTVLMDIDPEMANEIKSNPDWSAVLEIIADNDTILTYLAYVSLFIESIPPNFYAYLGGKGGAYVLMEVLLLILCSLLSAGAATAGRLAMLSARISSMAGKAARASRKIEKGMSAIRTFADALQNFADAATDLQALGKKLRKGRNSGMKFKGRSGTTLEARKKQQKRDKRCRICGKAGKSTPQSIKKGNLDYNK